MICNAEGDLCSAKELANEILCRCLENIESWFREHPVETANQTEKERIKINDQLVKQATRCFKLLGVHEDEIGEIFDPDDLRPQPKADKPQTTMDNAPCSVLSQEERHEKEVAERNALDRNR